MQTHCWINLSINQRNPNSATPNRVPSTGFLVHYLALTFKHAVEFSSFGRTPRRSFVSGLGQPDLLYEAAISSQTRPARPSHQTRRNLPDPGGPSRAHTCPDNSLASWAPGRPPQTLRSPASCTPLRPCKGYAHVSRGSNDIGGVTRSRPTRRRRGGLQGRVMVTAPTVRLPRRTTA